MKQIKIMSLLLCIILAGCATSGPKQETVDKPLKPEKIEKTETPQTTTPTATPGTVDKNDPYGGRSLPYGLSYGMSKKQVTDILTKVTGGAPENKGQQLIWKGLAVKKPQIIVVIGAIFESNKLAILDIVHYGKKSDETFVRIDAGFNKIFSELKAKHAMLDNQITKYRRGALFRTSEGHFLILLFNTDDEHGVYMEQLRHTEKLPQK